MAKQWIREPVSTIPDPDYYREKTENGWRLVALEWERDVDVSGATALEEVPFGLRVADDCMHLEENPIEKQVLTAMLDLIVDDELPFSRVTEELNRQGFRTRAGSKWTQTEVFNMLPRLIESAPHIFSTAQWLARKRRAGSRL